MALPIDASVFVTMERAGRPFGDLAVEWQNERFAVTAVTASELLYGVERAGNEQRRLRRRAYVENIPRTLPVIAFDLVIARHHAHLAASLAASGSPIGRNDLLIAATALSLGYEVASQNTREFQTVPGLVVRQPSW